MNKKGFSFVEILAVIVIMGILSGIGFGAYTRYRNKSLENTYKLFSENVASAAEEYFMSNSKETSVSLTTLVSEGYLESNVDPNSNNSLCTGTVTATSSGSSDAAIPLFTFKVNLNCSKYSGCKQYPGGGNC